MEGCREGEATVPCAQNGRGGGHERGPALSNRRTRPRGIGEREEGVLPSEQSPVAWRETALHLSVILLGEWLGEEGEAWQGGTEERWLWCQGREGGPEGNVGVRHYCFLLGRRAREWGAGGCWGDAWDGALGLAPPHPRCRWEPLQPSPMAMRIIKAETRGEAAGSRGCSLELCPPNGEKSNGTQSGRERWGVGGKWREDQALLGAQTPGWWCKCPPRTFPAQLPKLYGTPHACPRGSIARFVQNEVEDLAGRQ